MICVKGKSVLLLTLGCDGTAERVPAVLFVLGKCPHGLFLLVNVRGDVFNMDQCVTCRPMTGHSLLLLLLLTGQCEQLVISV